jgi:hypothetical protein
MAVGSDVVTWATAVSTNRNDGRKIIFRYAEQLRPNFDRASQPIRFIIVWKYQSETGQPIAGDHQRMSLLEETLESALEKTTSRLSRWYRQVKAYVNGHIMQSRTMNSWPDSTTPLLGCLNSRSRSIRQVIQIGTYMSNSERAL